MSLDPRTPVLVGAAAVSQRFDDPQAGRSAIALMAHACEEAAADAGNTDLLRAANVILVPTGTWKYPNAAGAIAQRLGNTTARAVRAELGILQTTLFRRAADAIARGDIDVALVVGGEAKWRDLRATIAKVELGDDDADAAHEPDEVIAPHGLIIAPAEITAGLVTAVSQYSIIENARRRADGQTLDEHAAAVASLWARFNEVAQSNPDAWNRAPMTAADIRSSGPKNKPLAFPYNKWHNSQWNVDQAACLVLCSVEAARAHGIAEDRWVFPHAIVDSDHMVPVSERGEMHRSPGFRIAGQRAFEMAGVRPDDIAHIDLYSCFPIAVRVQADELGIGTDRDLTITGGMTFAGGPLNNYVLQSTAAMVHRLRDDPGSTGLVTAISGMITKQGVSIWSTRPASGGYRSAEVSAEVEAATARRSPSVDGPADGTVAGYTVLYDGDTPTRTVAVVDADDGTRAVAVSDDAALARAATTDELGGRRVRVAADRTFAPA